MADPDKPDLKRAKVHKETVLPASALLDGQSPSVKEEQEIISKQIASLKQLQSLYQVGFFILISQLHVKVAFAFHSMISICMPAACDRGPVPTTDL